MEPALAVGISITVIMLSALIFNRLRLPHVLGVLVAGMLFGPFSPLAGVSLFGLELDQVIITEPEIVEVFAVIGAALILFGIGLEFSVIKLSRLGLFTFLAAVVKIGIVYLIAYGSLFALGFETQTSALVALVLSFSSTPIIIKLLEDSGKIRRPEVPFIISILIIEDLLIVFFLGLISEQPFVTNEYAFALSLLRVALTFVFAYLVLSKIINKFLELVSHSNELLILATVSLVLVIGYMSEAIGLSLSVGAFLAGSIIAGSPHSRKIEEKIKPFNSLFASFFFFSIGLLVNIYAVLSNLQLLLLFLFIGIVVRFFSAGLAAYIAGFPGRSACFCAATFVAMSELSLLLMSQGTAKGLIPPEFLGSFAFAIIVSSFVSAWMFSRENELYNHLRRFSPKMAIKNIRLFRSTALGMRRAFSESSRYYKVVEKLPSISYRTDQLSTHEHLALSSKNGALLLLVSVACYFGLFFAQQPQWSFLDPFYLFIFAGFFIPSALFLVNTKSLAGSILKMTVRTGKNSKYHAIGHFISSLFFIALSVLYVWAYTITPSSIAIILVLPSLAFAITSMVSAFRSAKLSSTRL